MYGTNQELYTKHMYGSSLLWVWGMGTNIKWVMITDPCPHQSFADIGPSVTNTKYLNVEMI